MASGEEELVSFLYYSYDVSNMITVAGTALIIYEQALTIGKISRIICQRGAISSIILGFNQVSLLLFAVFNILNMLNWTTTMSCEAITVCWNILLTTLVAISAVITALRVRVISGADWRLVLPTLILGMASIFIYIGFIFHGSTYSIMNFPTSPSITACVLSSPLSDAAGYLSEVILPFVCTFSSDVIVILVTWTRMHNYGDSSGLLSRTSPLRPRLAEVLLRDGTLYFVVISMLNIAQLVVNLVTVSENFLMSITIPMSSILITRFLLNVREAVYISTVDSSNTRSFLHSRDVSRSHENSELPTIRFAEPELIASPETSLQMLSRSADPEGRSGLTHEWDDIDEEDREGAEDDRDEVEMQAMGALSAGVDLDSRPDPSAA